MSKDPILLVNVDNLPPEGLEREGDVTAEDLELPEDERFSVADQIHLDLFISEVKKGILCQGRLHADLACQCDRCLSTYSHGIALSQICHLFEDIEEDILDLTYAIREDILLAVPQHTLCDQSCRGLCSQCGQDLNKADCECAPTAQEHTDVWSPLDKLNLSE